MAETLTLREVQVPEDIAVCAGIAFRARPFEAFDHERFGDLIARGALQVWLDPAERGFVSLGGTGSRPRVLRVAVVPADRRNGLGTSLYEAAVSQVRAGAAVLSWVPRHDPGAAVFAHRMGLRPDPDSVLDECTYGLKVASFSAIVTVPSGVCVTSLGGHSAEALAGLLASARSALPDDHVLFDEDIPILESVDPDLSFVALVGEVPVGMTLVRRDGLLPHVLDTFVEPDARRRGIARALKAQSLTAMREAEPTPTSSRSVLPATCRSAG